MAPEDHITNTFATWRKFEMPVKAVARLSALYIQFPNMFNLIQIRNLVGKSSQQTHVAVQKGNCDGASNWKTNSIAMKSKSLSLKTYGNH